MHTCYQEAARTFRLAIQDDPRAAMNYWGLAYALGPFHNRYSNPDRATNLEGT